MMDYDNLLTKIPRAFFYDIQKKRRTLPIRKEVYKIGRERSFVDYCLDRPTVSRVHAQVTYHDDNFYITDLDSTNHTYINGNMILTKKEFIIKNGNIIRFADTEMMFKVINI